MSSERRIEFEVEVPATPEQAWEAIATGPGITAWFMPAEVDGRVGGTVVHRPEAGLESEGTVRAYEPPQRFAYEEPAWTPDGRHAGHSTATEFLVEARSGGTCVVRVVMSGFGDGAEWDRAIESYSAGWRQALLSLRLYLTHFPGEAAESVTVGVVLADQAAAVWERLTQALGLPPAPATGARIATSAPGAPALAGTVERSAERMLTLLLDEPGRGVAFVGVGGPDDGEVFALVRAQLFGRGAREAAAEAQAAWQAWFAANMPSTAAARS